MRILFISEVFYPHWTGLSKSILKTALRLQEKGHECAVLTTRHEKNLPFFELYKDLEIYRSSPVLNVSRTKYSVNVIFKFMKLARNYDLIFINTPNSNVVWFTLIAKLYGKKVAIFINGDLILPKGLNNRILEKIFDTSMSISCKLADIISTYTKDYAENSRILKNYLDKFTPLLLPVGANEKRIDDVCDSKMKKLKIEKKVKFLVGFAGRFVEEKGFDILLKAIPKVIEKHPAVHFVYAGKPAQYEDFYEKNKNLWDRNSKNVTHIDFLTTEQEMNAFYKNLDLLVISSRSDCFPNVQVEAMEHGVPIVVTNIPGARWLVKVSGFGQLVEPENESALADAIMNSLLNKETLMALYPKVKKILNSDLFFDQFKSLHLKKD